jgi:hypothetical protein
MLEVLSSELQFRHRPFQWLVLAVLAEAIVVIGQANPISSPVKDVLDVWVEEDVRDQGWVYPVWVQEDFGPPRRAAALTSNLPAETQVLLAASTSLPVSQQVQFTAGTTTLSQDLSAGDEYGDLQLQSPASSAWPEGASPKAWFIKHSTATGTDAADATTVCDDTSLLLNDDTLTGDLSSTTGGAQLVVTGDDPLNSTSWELSRPTSSVNLGLPFAFLKAGSFRLCYSSGGLHRQLLGPEIRVAGLQDSCEGESCLSKRAALGHVVFGKAASADAISLFYPGATLIGANRNASWSAVFTASYHNITGTELNQSAPRCGSEMPDSIFGTGIPMELYDASITKQMVSSLSSTTVGFGLDFPATQGGLLTSSTFGPRTVAACYCPDAIRTDRIGNDTVTVSGGNCQDYTDFVQTIGVVYIYASAMCNPADVSGYPSCTTQYHSVVAGQSFQLRVLCPPGGCTNGTLNYIKLVPRNATTSLASWNSGNGCRFLLHQSHWQPASNCKDYHNCTLPGGARQDWKAWGDASQWWMAKPGSAAADSDVCYCQDPCKSSSDWFKVGELRTTTINLVGHSHKNQADDLRALAYVNLSGTVGFSRPTADASALGFETGGILKLIEDTYRNATSSTCNATSFNPHLVDGVNSTATAAKFQGYAGSAVDAEKLIFHGGDASNRAMLVKQAGVIAICYCATLDGNICASGNYIVIDRIMVRGPRGGEVFKFSIGEIFSLDFHGHGFDTTNRLRISDGPCNASSGTGYPDNPLNSEQHLYLGCPDNCHYASSASENIQQYVLKHDAVECDEMMSNCKIARISQVQMLSAINIVQLSFGRIPDLDSGDVISLGTGYTSSNATTDDLAAFRGSFDYIDSVGSNPNVLGHSVTKGSGTNVFLLPLSFTAGSNGIKPSFTPTSTGGEWTRHNRGKTKAELMGRQKTTNPLSICWSSGVSGYGNFTAQVGTLELQEDPLMPTVGISLVAPVAGNSTPAIIAFKTGYHSQYLNAKNEMALVLRFNNLDRLWPLSVDGGTLSSSGVPRQNGTQGTCGGLIQEVWSNETEGFPLPSKCYYGKTLSITGQNPQRDLVLEFEPHNGLAPLAKYQIVMNVGTSVSARLGNEVLRILATDDLQTKYGVNVEANNATIAAVGAPGVPAGLGTQPSAGHAQLGGLELQGGTAHGADGWSYPLLRANDTRNFYYDFRLVGGGSGVSQGAFVRLVFWPLTQWHISGPVNCKCTDNYVAGIGNLTCKTASSTCDSEALEPLVGKQNNSVTIQMGTGIAGIVDLNKPIVTVWGEADIGSAFFPSRMAAVVLNPDGATAQYIRPGFTDPNGYLYMPFSASRPSTAMIVAGRGDGNMKPFVGADGNELYIRFLLGATIFAQGSGNTSITVGAPPIYRAITDIAGLSGDEGLVPFVSQPHGTGTLRHGSWTGTPVNATEPQWTFTFDPNGALYANSSVYMKITVNNPVAPLSTKDSTNTWYTSIYDSKFNISLGKQVFSVPAQHEGKFAKNVAVRRQIMFAQILPSSFVAGATHTVWVFFELENRLAPGGYIAVDAANLFDFGSACSVSELSAEYYDSGNFIFRLPELHGCISKEAPRDTEGRYSRAMLHTKGNVYANTRYAFGLRVTNAAEYDVLQQSNWYFSTLDSKQSGLDIYGGTVPFNADENAGRDFFYQGSLGIYQDGLAKTPQISFRELRPYSVTLTYTDVYFVGLEVDNDLMTTLRVTCPLDYMWQVGGVFEAKPRGATVDFPASPVVNDTVHLLWPTAFHMTKSETYGFGFKIRLPDRAGTWNKFFIEFGYNAETLTNRTMAGSVDGPTIRSTYSAEVDWTSGRYGLSQLVQIQLGTVTVLMDGQGFVFQGDETTAKLDCKCPMDHESGGRFTCRMSRASMTGGILILMIVASGRAEPGLYKFNFWCQNPSMAVIQGSWFLGSFENADKYPTAVALDKASTVEGFAVRPPMAHFELKECSRSTQCDVRPERRSGVVFAFKLDWPWQSPTVLRLRAPSGSKFAADCTLDLITDRHSVLGSGSLPNSFASLPTSSGCRGYGHKALISFPETLPKGYNYAFRIFFKNPKLLQDANQFSLEAHNESSLPVTGYTVLSFQNASVSFASMATQKPGIEAAEAKKNANRVKIEFTPSVLAQQFTVNVAYGFDLRYACDEVHLRGVLLDGGRIVFPDIASCSVEDQNRRLRIKLQAPVWELLPIIAYTLEFDMLNPSNPTQNAKIMVTSLLLNGEERDEKSFQAPDIISSFYAFEVKNVGNVQAAGRAVKIEISIKSRYDLGDYERFVLNLPPYFQFATSDCKDSFTWGEPATGAFPVCECSDNVCRMTFTASPTAKEQFKAPWPSNRFMKFTLSLTNPAKTPTGFENFWIVSHLNRISSTTVTRALGTQRGYQIIPSLKSVRIELVGETVRAGASDASMEISVMPSNDATMLRVRAQSPEGWSFYYSTICCAGRCQRPPNLRGVELVTTTTTTTTSTTSITNATKTFNFSSGSVGVRTETGNGTSRNASGNSTSTGNGTRGNAQNASGTASSNTSNSTRLRRLTVGTPESQSSTSDPSATPEIEETYASERALQAEDPYAATRELNETMEARGLAIRGGQMLVCTVSGIILPNLTGPAVFEVDTFNELNNNNFRLLDYGGTLTAFRLPGAVHVKDAWLRMSGVGSSATQMGTLLPPRIGVSEAVADFWISAGSGANIGEFVMVQCKADMYKFKTSGAALYSGTGISDDVEATAALTGSASLTADDNTLRLPLKSDVTAWEPYTLRIYLTAIKAVENDVIKCSIEFWSDEQVGLPIATNDATIIPQDKVRWSTAVALKTFVIDKGPSAPTSDVTLFGRTEPGQVLTLIAPPGVTIAYPCFPTSCDTVTNDFAGSGRNAAAGLKVAQDGRFGVRVKLPRAWMPGERQWLLLQPSKNAVGELQAGMLAVSKWGMHPGYDLVPMAAKISYAAIAGQEDSKLTVAFQLSSALGANLLGRFTVVIQAPRQYILKCDEFSTTGFQESVLVDCTYPDAEPSARVHFEFGNTTLEGGSSYAMTLGVSIPEETPVPNLFSIRVVDEDSLTIDANLEVQGQRVLGRRVRSSFAAQVADVPDHDWLKRWAETARRNGVFTTTLAKTLKVPERQIIIENVLTSVAFKRGRRLEARALTGRMDVEFAVEVPGDSQARIEALLSNPSTAGTLTSEFATASSEAGLVSLPLTIEEIAPAEVVEPMEGERPRLSWSSSEPEAETQVTVGIQITRGTDSVQAILIALPEGFMHWLNRPSDFRIVTQGPEDLPIAASTDWVDARHKGMVKILTQPGKKLFPGYYSFKFPALNPLVLPIDNVWRLSFCSSSKCDGPVSPHVLVTFAIPGFKFGERPWDWKRPTAGSTRYVYSVSLLAFLFLSMG